MMRRPPSWVLPLLLLSSAVISGCLSMPESTKYASDVQMPLTDIGQTAVANNRFALDMYAQLASKDENLFFSPWSLNSALAMTSEGARGRTADEMHSVLHFSGNDSARRQAFSALDLRINANNSGYILSTANALWADRAFPLLGEYADLVNSYYHAKAVNVDFKGDPDDARKTINSWVEQRTAGKIKGLIPPGYVDSLTCLVLTNAIYFNGTWIKEFDRSLTRDEDFFTGEGKAVKVPMMRQLDEGSYFNYLETGDMQMLQMPYQGENLSLVILLPREQDIAPLERSLTVERLAQWRDGLQLRRVDVYIPKFKINANYFLAENFTNLGMPTAFAEMADFSGISPGRELFISEVIHQAYVDVNEEGTEAAAATAVCVAESASPLPEEKVMEFRADHPFLFLIQDRVTGCILFLGKVNDPGKG